MKNPSKFLFLFLGISVAVAPSFALAAGAVSVNWSGYAADSGSTYTAVGSTWTVPTPNASSANGLATDATWIGIGGMKETGLIQAGTAANVQNGRVEYDAWYETLPSAAVTIPLAIHGGDSVTVSLTETSTNVWHLSFKDTTTGGDYEKDIQYSSSRSSAEWIEEMPMAGSSHSTSFLTLDNFGSVRFTNSYAVVDGVRKSIADTGAQPITMAGGRQVALATPSELANDSFTVTRSTSQTPQTVAQQQSFAPQPMPMPQMPPQGFGQQPMPMQQMPWDFGQQPMPMPQMPPQSFAQQPMPQQMPMPIPQQMPPQLAYMTHRGHHGHSYGYGFGGGYGNGQYDPSQYMMSVMFH